MHTMKLLGDVGHVESHFGPFGYIVTISLFGGSGNVMQDRCTFCAECTMGSEIIMDAPNGTLRSCVSCGNSFQSV
jgi:hypothetical protein